MLRPSRVLSLQRLSGSGAAWLGGVGLWAFGVGDLACLGCGPLAKTFFNH